MAENTTFGLCIGADIVKRQMHRYFFGMVAAAMLLSVSSTYASEPLSTSDNGDFQAIASSTTSIQLFWRHGEKPARIYQDDKLVGEYSPDASSAFARTTVANLKPNSRYSFRLGDSGPTISEKTWGVPAPKESFDVLVVGGTGSGFAAALTVGRMGLKVALVEPTTRLGGMSSNGLGSTDIRKVSRANGVFEDFRRRVISFYGNGDGLRYESRVAQAIMKDMIYDLPNVTLLMGTKVEKPLLCGQMVLGAKIRESATGKSGEIVAKVTIDATDNGDFAAASGAKYRVGREPRTKAEPHAGRIYFDDSKQEILPGSTGKGDKEIQSYAYLMLLKDYGTKAPRLVAKPRFYDPEIYRHSPEWELSWAYNDAQLPNKKFEVNQHPFGTDWPGINFDYPAAKEARRREIEAMYKDRALGYLYYLQNEQGHRNLGLADDEFLENENFPVSIYVRESRRIIGDSVMNESDVSKAGEYHRTDSIAIGDYAMDSHAMEDLKDPGRRDKGEGEFWLESFTPWYQIPFGVMSPKGVDGLLVSTAVSSTHVSYGTLRMEPVRMSLGQAAGAAAYWSILYSEPVRNIPPSWIQDVILQEGAYINWNSDVDRDTRHFRAISFLTARGFFEGEAFRPEDALTQGEALASINRMQELEGNPAGLPSYTAVNPSQVVTRGEFARWLVLAKEISKSDAWSIVKPTRASYADVPTDSPYFSAVETLRDNSIRSESFSDPEFGKFKPDAPILRADAAWTIFLAHRLTAMNNWMP